jgi:hypothetical protein
MYRSAAKEPPFGTSMKIIRACYGADAAGDPRWSRSVVSILRTVGTSRRDGDTFLVHLADVTIRFPIRTAAVLAATALAVASANASLATARTSVPATSPTYQALRQDVIINADIWAAKPEMMAAGLGFTNIIGVPNLSTSNVPLSKTLAVLAGGTWNHVHCTSGQTPPLPATPRQ